MVAHMALDEGDRDGARDHMKFAGAIRSLVTALSDANGICRSAMAITERIGRETNWSAFRDQLRASLSRQHVVMYPAESSK